VHEEKRTIFLQIFVNYNLLPAERIQKFQISSSKMSDDVKTRNFMEILEDIASHIDLTIVKIYYQ